MISDDTWREIESQEERLGKILAARKPEKEARHWWDSPGLTAIVGGVASALITFGGSWILKHQEAQTQQVSAGLEQMRKAIADANDNIAGMLKANEERYLLATGQLDQLDSLQRQDIARGTNRIQQQWRQQRENAELGVSLAFPEDTVVQVAWATARDSLELYTVCLEHAYLESQHKRAPIETCAAERAGTRNSAKILRSRFTKAYVVARR
jgi:hypothetical protein